MKYRLSFICTDGKEHVEQNYDVEFFYNEEQYGNGTYMSCKNLKQGHTDYHLDIRYDTDYNKDSQIQYICDWALNTWNGKNGSYKITYIQCYDLDCLKDKRGRKPDDAR